MDKMRSMSFEDLKSKLPRLKNSFRRKRPKIIDHQKEFVREELYCYIIVMMQSLHFNFFLLQFIFIYSKLLYLSEEIE